MPDQHDQRCSDNMFYFVSMFTLVSRLGSAVISAPSVVVFVNYCRYTCCSYHDPWCSFCQILLYYHRFGSSIITGMTV